MCPCYMSSFIYSVPLQLLRAPSEGRAPHVGNRCDSRMWASRINRSRCCHLGVIPWMLNPISSLPSDEVTRTVMCRGCQETGNNPKRLLWSSLCQEKFVQDIVFFPWILRQRWSSWKHAESGIQGRGQEVVAEPFSRVEENKKKPQNHNWRVSCRLTTAWRGRLLATPCRFAPCAWFILQELGFFHPS